jgi:hypothetical protein
MLCCALALLAGRQMDADENPTQVTLDKEAVFAAPGGDEVHIAPGAYQVTASGPHLALTPAAGGAHIVVAAEADRQAEPIEEPVAIYTAGDDETGAVRHLVLLLPDGSRREAVGAEGAVLARGAAKIELPAAPTKALAGKKLALTGKRRPKIFEGFGPGSEPAGEPPAAKAPPGTAMVLPDTVAELLPSGKQTKAGGAEPPQTTACTWRTSDIIEKRIDVSAQVSLMRMMNRGGQDRRDASAMIGAVKSGAIEGMFRPGLMVTVARGQRMTPPRPYWELLQGQPSACLLEPGGEPPMIVYRDKMVDAQTDQALRAAWAQCGLPTPEPPCDYVVDREQSPPCKQATETIAACFDRGGVDCPWPPSCQGDRSCKGTQAEQDAYMMCIVEKGSNELHEKCGEEAKEADPACFGESETSGGPAGGGKAPPIPATGGV